VATPPLSLALAATPLTRGSACAPTSRSSTAARRPGFDPGAGISAEPYELTPPAGCLLIGYLHAEPAGCGAVKHHPGAPSEIKRMAARR